MLIGYARVSTVEQDLESQSSVLEEFGVARDMIFTDRGLSGTSRQRPGLREALAACRAGDQLVVTKLDRLARSLPDARDIAIELERKGVALRLGTSLYDPADPVGKLLFNVLAMVAEFEGDLIRARTLEGMAVARAKGRLQGRKPKLSVSQTRHLLKLHAAGQRSVGEIAELFGVSRATVYRSIERAAPVAPPSAPAVVEDPN